MPIFVKENQAIEQTQCTTIVIPCTEIGQVSNANMAFKFFPELKKEYTTNIRNLKIGSPLLLKAENVNFIFLAIQESWKIPTSPTKLERSLKSLRQYVDKLEIIKDLAIPNLSKSEYGVDDLISLKIMKEQLSGTVKKIVIYK